MLPIPEINFRRTPVTLLLAAVAAAVELVCTFDPERREVYYMTWKLGMLSTIWSGELWRPFTTSLLHGSVVHAAFNIYWLITFGRVLEPFFGSFRYLLAIVLLSFVSMVPSFLVSNWDAPLDGQHAIVGLSGVVYGLFGILWAGRRHRRDFEAVCGQDVVRVFVVWFFLCIGLTYMNLMPVANVAHGMGCAVGVLYGLALLEPARRWAWRSLAVLATLLLLFPSIAAPGHPLYAKYVKNEQIRALIRQMEEQPTLPEESRGPAEAP